MKLTGMFETEEEDLTYVYLCKFLSGNAGPTAKVRNYQKQVMAKRRKLGLTQRAQREYIQRNLLAFLMYKDLMKLAPELVRTGQNSFRRQDEEVVAQTAQA